MLKLKFSIIFVLVKCLFSIEASAIVLTDLGIINHNCDKSIVVLDCEGIPVYRFYLLRNPHRLVLDISHVITPVYVERLPIYFSTRNLVHRIRINKFLDQKNVRFIFDLTCSPLIDDIFLENTNGFYTLLLVITRQSLLSSTDFITSKKYISNTFIRLPIFQNYKEPLVSYMENWGLSDVFSSSACQIVPIVVAIDAGHGGHDPGARGHTGLYEKNITIAIAKKFKQMLDKNPMFRPVMIRDGDYFLSILERSELARSKGAKVLLSIHADAVSKSSKNNIRGASVWVLSNRRANIEMTQWLKNTSKWSQLLGGASSILESSVNIDPYFSRAILDLQFCYSQKIGYEIALHILRELKNVSVLHKYMPEYSNFGILRSLDIPSVLIETGFMTHAGEEKLLANETYQKKIAFALYKGLCSYFMGHPSCISSIKKKIDGQSFLSFKDYKGCAYSLPYYG